MGNTQTLERGDIVEWYLKSKREYFELYGKVSSGDEVDGVSRASLLSDSKLIGTLGVNCKNCTLKITHLNDKGNFMISGKGKDEKYRLRYDDSYVGFTLGHSANYQLLDIAYFQIGDSKTLDRLDTRSVSDRMLARGLGMDVGISDKGLRIGRLQFGFGREQSIKELRNECNELGMSCRDKNGKYLSRSALLKKIENK